MLWIKFSHINLLSVNNTTSLNSGLFRECSNLAAAIEVLRYLTLTPQFPLTRTRATWHQSSIEFCVQLIPPSVTSLLHWVTAQTASPVIIFLPYSTPDCFCFLSLNSACPSLFLPESLIIWGKGRQKAKVLHSHFWKS